MDNHTKSVLDQITAEREYQVQRWGNADDEVNMPNDFISYIAHYSTSWLKGEFAPYSEEAIVAFHRSMIKSAAIATAAAEYAAKIINGEIDRTDVVKKD